MPRWVWFAGAYVLLQVVLIVTAYRRPDCIFGFQMFNESSTIEVHLSRRVAEGVVVPVRDGAWLFRQTSGSSRTFRWSDRVTDPILRMTDRPVHASYGVDAQLFRLQHALDDVVTHLAEDRETTALVADVDVVRNGQHRYRTRLESVSRMLP